MDVPISNLSNHLADHLCSFNPISNAGEKSGERSGPEIILISNEDCFRFHGNLLPMNRSPPLFLSPLLVMTHVRSIASCIIRGGKFPSLFYVARMRSEERRVGKECRSRWS